MFKKKINRLLIGSNNIGKIKEIRDLLPKTVKVFSPKELNLKSPPETGKTFEKNALIKAKYFSKKTKEICLADDSGLEIDLLNKSPGIFSARWGGKKNNFDIAIKKVYSKLNNKNPNWKNKIVKARFICSLSIYWPNGKYIIKSGKIEGTISHRKKGINGFGYDPIFIPYGKKITFGQMSKKSKYRIDHRSKAFKKIKKFF